MQKWTFGLGLLGAIVGGCTFYTACPTGNANGNPNTTGGTSNGGSSTGGTNASGDASGGAPEFPRVAWQNATSNLAGLDSACGNLTIVKAKPDENIVFAGVALNRLFQSADGGQNWTEVALGKGTAPLSGGVHSMTFDPVNTSTFWITTIYGDRGVWRTDDDGDTFQSLGSIYRNDLVSMDFNDPDRQVMVAGSHEANRTVWHSADGGQNWDDIGQFLPSDSRSSSYPLVLTPDTYLLGAGLYGPGVSGIFRTTDSGAHWTRVSKTGGSGFPLLLADGTIYWTNEDGAVERSTDDGVSWEEALPKGSAQGYQALLQLPDGRIAVLGANANGILISGDGFATTTKITEAVPWLADGFTYSDANRAFFVWHEDCGMKVLDDAILRADFDYEAN